MCDFALPEEFTEEQKIALLAVSEFVFDIDWAKEKIHKGEYKLWDDVKDYLRTINLSVVLLLKILKFLIGLTLILILKNSAMTLPLNIKAL